MRGVRFIPPQQSDHAEPAAINTENKLDWSSNILIKTNKKKVNINLMDVYGGANEEPDTK